ncbi:hypothetical protein BCV70DRAFT_195962 [Testicularia cyperi]|uniref:Pentacotripeptide-repeat region of PRORP domain-containing protein n=1 Tax=Testicularia cyperi TaxID=1882483 RepID=A0A317XFM1_9BASI|nr:hypothetical protein BCV70DRAFT_195962 [Testicularia cyperi]
MATQLSARQWRITAIDVLRQGPNRKRISVASAAPILQHTSLHRTHVSLASATTYTHRSESQQVRDAEDEAHASDLQGSKPRRADLSRFFDRKDIDAKADAHHTGLPLYEIVSYSKSIIQSFRDALKTRQPKHILEAYDDLVDAVEMHRSAWAASSSKPFKLDHSFPLRKNDIQTAIRILVEHAKNRGRTMSPRLIRACRTMFQDMASRFEYAISPTDLHYQVLAHCMQDPDAPGFRDPAQVFADLRRQHSHWQTSSVEWNLVASYLADTGQYQRACELWTQMLDHGTLPGTDIRNTMVLLHFRNRNLQEAEQQLLDLEQQKELGLESLARAVVGFTSAAADALVPSDGTMTSPVHRYAAALRELLFDADDPPNGVAAWVALLRYDAHFNGPSQAIDTAKRAGMQGAVTSGMLAVLLQLHTDRLQGLQTSDEAIELLDSITAVDATGKARPGPECYQHLLVALLGGSTPSTQSDDYDSGGVATPNQIREAQLLYDHIRQEQSVRPTAQMVGPLLSAYCNAFLPSLPSALSLVQDLLDHAPSASPVARPRRWGESYSGSRLKKSTTSSDGPSDMADLVTTFVSACTRQRDLSMAQELLGRLRRAGLGLDAGVKASIATQLLSVATTWREAFDLYQQVARLQPVSSSSGSASPEFTERGYVAILEAFRELGCATTGSTGDRTRGAAPPEYLLQILQDMRGSGYRPSCSVYTSILNYYSKLDEPSYEGVKATHEILKQDATLDPDLALINALMNGYNRVDEPAVVLAIWDSLMASRQQIDGVTLSIFFDTAGRHGLLALARRAILTIRRAEAEKRELGDDGSASSAPGWKIVRPSLMNKGAWDAWLECLARCGRLEEAIELAFGEMRRSLLREAIDTRRISFLVARSSRAPIRDTDGTVVGPDAKTFGTLLRFAAKERDRRQKRLFASAGVVVSVSAAEEAAERKGSSVWHLLRQRIRDDYSWVYQSIKQIGATA